MSHCVDTEQGLPATRPYLTAPPRVWIGSRCSKPTSQEVEIPRRSEQLTMQIPANIALGFVCRISDGARELACRTNSGPGPLLHVADRQAWQGCRRAASAQSFL